MSIIIKTHLLILISCLIGLLDLLTLIRNNERLNIYHDLKKKRQWFCNCASVDGSTESVTRYDKSTVKCALCNQIVEEIFEGFNNGMTDKEISFLIGQRCEAHNIFNFKLCNGTATIIMVRVVTKTFYSGIFLSNKTNCLILLHFDSQL